MRDHLAYLRYVVMHKYHVFRACRALNVPLLQAVTHDASKFLPSEWKPYVECFYAPDGSSRCQETEAFVAAWNRHQKRNLHHWQFWLITMDRGETFPIPMPMRYVREMVADWIGAGIVLTGRKDPHVMVEWYCKNWHKMILHPTTRAAVEGLLRSFFFDEDMLEPRPKGQPSQATNDEARLRRELSQREDQLRACWSAARGGSCDAPWVQYGDDPGALAFSEVVLQHRKLVAAEIARDQAKEETKTFYDKLQAADSEWAAASGRMGSVVRRLRGCLDAGDDDKRSAEELIDALELDCNADHERAENAERERDDYKAVVDILRPIWETVAAFDASCGTHPGDMYLATAAQLIAAVFKEAKAKIAAISAERRRGILSAEQMVELMETET